MVAGKIGGLTRAGAASLLLALGATPACAEAPQKLLLFGAEAAPHNAYAYAGAVLPLAGGQLGKGYVQRWWLDSLGYSYQGDGQRVRVQAPFGISASLGYQDSYEGGWHGIYAGLSHRDSRFNPDTVESDIKGPHTDIKLDGDLFRQLRPHWSFLGGASVQLNARSYWLRARLMRDASNGMALGPELVVLGDPNFQANLLGLAWTRTSGGRSIGVKVGARYQRDVPTRPFLGVEFVLPY